jgi:cytochrome b involved in lipid metabolism
MKIAISMTMKAYILLAILVLILLGCQPQTQQQESQNLPQPKVEDEEDENESQNDAEENENPVVASPNQTQNQSQQPIVIVPKNTTRIITQSELALHNNMTSCWVVYNGGVYDLTAWLPRHPGGAPRILPTCGTMNFQSTFEKKHGQSKAQLFFQVSKFLGEFQQVGMAG